MKFAKIERNANCRDTNLSLENMALVRSKVCRGKTVYRGYFLSLPAVFLSRVSRVSRFSHNSYFKPNVCVYYCKRDDKESSRSSRRYSRYIWTKSRKRESEREREIASLLAVQNPPSVAPVPLTFRPLVEYLQVDIPLPENIVENELCSSKT